MFDKKKYEDVIKCAPNIVDHIEKSWHLLNLIGSSYLNLNNLEKAKQYLNFSIDKNPLFPDPYSNLAVIEEYLGNIDKAIIYYNKALNIDNDFPTIKYNLSLLNLFKGYFDIAWSYFESRWKNPLFGSKQLQTDRPRWSPSIGSDHHVMIWPEQGIGDYILYSRFLNDLSLKVNKVTALIDKKLKPLYSRTFPQIEFITECDPSSIDYHAPIGDLAKFYVNSFEDVKLRSDTYLQVNKSRSQKLKEALPKGKKICGISWVSKNDSIGANKSMTLEDLKDLLVLPDVTFVDLQYTDTSEERALFKQKYGVEIIKLEEVDNFDDIDGLASLIDACDCVVSVSNTTVHIAGAIGKQTYLMLPQGKGRLWYWSKEDEQSIWYKSIKIIEQTKIGHWNNVVQNIKK